MNLVYFRNLNTNNKITILILSYLIFAATAIFGLIITSLNRITFISNEIIASKIQLMESEDQNFEKDIITKKVAQIESDIQKLESIYINKNRDLEFITSLEDLARQNNITQIINLNQKQNKQTENYEIIPMELNCSGNFQNLLKYLTGLESLNYVINITNLEISKAQSSAGSRSLDPQTSLNFGPTTIFKISALTYWK